MTAMDLSILYRGPLASCNYGCDYCPFAKRAESYEELESDRQALARFIDWTAEQPHRLGILFTPWGEALIRHWYQEALCKLSHQKNIRRVAIQTNLSCALNWIGEANPRTLALWCTYHPTEISIVRFLAHCAELQRAGLRYSVGIVGLKEHFEHASRLRNELPSSVYLWINAYKRVADYYSASEIEFLRALDPHFVLNTIRHPSLNKACRTGANVISVDGAGDIRRCHFIENVIGNIYNDDWTRALKERPCANATCGCHIGYVHLDELNLYDLFGDGVLERIPAEYFFKPSAQHKAAHALPHIS